MNAKEQASFIKELTENITKELLCDVSEGKVPEEWDGIELRQLLADRFARAVFKNVFTRSRKTAYNNTVLVNDL